MNLTAWLGSGNPAYPENDCGNNHWLVLHGTPEQDCVKGVLSGEVVSKAYNEELGKRQQEHQVAGFDVEKIPYNLIDEVIANLTKAWRK